MFGKKITNILLVLSVAIFLFGSGYKLGEFNTGRSKLERPNYNILNANPSDKVKNIDFSLFWDTWNVVEQKFIDRKKLDPQKMFYGAIKGMVYALDDPYTFFLTPEENKQSKDDLGGKFEGIGAQLGLKDNQIIVVSPLRNSPAEHAGLKAGDYIVKVDDQPVKGWTLPQAITKIKGKKGTKVKLTVNRNGRELEFTITRDQIVVDSLELSYESKRNCTSDCPKVAYLKINQFGDTTNDEWAIRIDEIEKKWKQKEIKGMVLDLRGNPGGYIDSSAYLATEFLPLGKLIVKQESTTDENRNYYAERVGKLQTIPLVVLIDRGSASASEILAGALRDYKRATLVGELSYGKGSVQAPIDLKGGAGIHVTIAKWILPNGDWINGKGIQPEIKVENKIPEGNTLTKENDMQLEKAIEIIVP